MYTHMESLHILPFNVIIQVISLYILYNIYTSTIMYYTVFYLLLQTVVAGLMLMYYTLDLFSAFLFLAEFVIIFISILLIFYLNVYGTTSQNVTIFFLKRNLFLILPSFFNLTNNIYCEFENISQIFLNSSIFYENYYMYLSAKTFNDFYGLFINLFSANAVPTMSVGYLLLIGSFVCVTIHSLIKTIKMINYSDFFLVFEMFKDFSKFIFMRKQNLTDQMHVTSGSRFFKKKFE